VFLTETWYLHRILPSGKIKKLASRREIERLIPDKWTDCGLIYNLPDSHPSSVFHHSPGNWVVQILLSWKFDGGFNSNRFRTLPTRPSTHRPTRYAADLSAYHSPDSCIMLRRQLRTVLCRPISPIPCQLALPNLPSATLYVDDDVVAFAEERRIRHRQTGRETHCTVREYSIDAGDMK
jgi:hypothetical protein